MFDDDQELSSYLDNAKARIDERCGKDALRVRNEIKLFLISQKKLTGISMKQVLENFSDIDALIDKFTSAKSGSPAFENSQSNVAKVFIAGIVVVVAGLVIAFIFFLKSLTPIFEFDAKKGEVSLFGDKIQLKNIPDIKYQVSHSSNSRHHESGILPLKDAKKIIIAAKTLNVSMTSGSKPNSLVYECEGNNSIRPQGNSDNGIYYLNFANAADCSFQLPSNIKFEINSDMGNINLDDIRQSFVVNLKKGNVNWIRPQDGLFDANVSVETGNISGNFDLFKSSDPKEKAEITVEVGNVSIL